MYIANELNLIKFAPKMCIRDRHTGELGRFKIKKEESSSAGVRRIKAVLIKE